jgi:prefoldin subunit 5
MEESTKKIIDELKKEVQRINQQINEWKGFDGVIRRYNKVKDELLAELEKIKTNLRQDS